MKQLAKAAREAQFQDRKEFSKNSKTTSKTFGIYLQICVNEMYSVLKCTTATYCTLSP